MPIPEKRLRRRNKGHPLHSRGQKQKYIDRGHNISRGESIDWIVIANLIANTLNQNRQENEQCIAGFGLLKKRCRRSNFL